MPVERVWTYERLMEYVASHNIILTENYEGKNVSGDVHINGKCNTEGCNGVFCKLFKNLVNNDTPFCPLCSKTVCARRKIATFVETQGTTHPMKNPKNVEKQQNTNLERYNTTNCMHRKEVRKKKEDTYHAKTGFKQPFLNPIVREKIANTNIERIGVACPLSSPLVRKKGEITMVRLYGVKHNTQMPTIHAENQRLYGVQYTIQRPDVKKKSEETHMKRRGVKTPFACPLVRLKAQKTSLSRYNCKYPIQHPLIFQRAMRKSYCRKPYTFPSGKRVMIQGYEPHALDKLLNDVKIEEKHIVTGTKYVPKISYKTADGNDHVHFPDIYIPNRKWIIEVKSTFTVGIEKDHVFLKLEAARKQGYNYNIWVFNDKKELVAIH
jgi:hypothetical protein